MKITTKSGDKVRFKDIRPGDVFQNKDRDTFIKTGEAKILMGPRRLVRSTRYIPKLVNWRYLMIMVLFIRLMPNW